MSTTPSVTRTLAAAAFVGLLACGGSDSPAPDAGGDTPAPAPAAATVAGLNGEAEYQAVCAVCHQNDGNGMAGAFPPLTDSPIVTAETPDRLIATILKGMVGPITIKGVEYNSVMVAHEGTLSDEQIAAITTYERSSWGHTASAVTPEKVAEVRAAVASRTTSWTIEELEATVP